MEKTIVLFGGSGLLGESFRRTAALQGYKVLAPTHAEVDITNLGHVQKFLAAYTPQYVLNAAALINVDWDELHPEEAYKVNAEGAAVIAQALGLAKLGNTKLLQVSTSYVFDGKKKKYTEDDLPAPLNVYGASKLEGERLVAKYCKEYGVPYAVLRASWLYSGSRDTFVDIAAKALMVHKPFMAFADQTGNLTSAEDFASSIISNFIENDQPSGIYHVVGDSSPITKYDIAQKIAEILELPLELVVGSTSTAGGAKRPMWGVLVNTKLPPLPAWQDSLREYLLHKYRQ
jgi:dTDP-4-dehydrorhamnose reductase